MAKLYEKECLCCGEKFQTSRTDKIFKNSLHQRSYNNNKQANKRKLLDQLNKPINATYKIFKELLGNKISISISKQFLKGKGADLKYFTHVKNIDGQPTKILYDIEIRTEEENINLRKNKEKWM